MQEDAHDMEWPEVRQRLLAAAALLKERKAVDIGIKSLPALHLPPWTVGLPRWVSLRI